MLDQLSDIEADGWVVKTDCPRTDWRETMEGFKCSCGFSGVFKRYGLSNGTIPEIHSRTRPATIAEVLAHKAVKS